MQRGIIRRAADHAIPGAFKNAFDLLGREWQKKAVGFVGYGAALGVRAVEAWRTVVANFSMYDVRSQVALSIFGDLTEYGVADSDRLDADLDALFAELEPAAAGMTELRTRAFEGDFASQEQAA